MCERIFLALNAFVSVDFTRTYNSENIKRKNKFVSALSASNVEIVSRKNLQRRNNNTAFEKTTTNF